MSKFWCSNWDQKQVGELCDVIDPHPSHRAPKEELNGIFFLGIGDLKENGEVIGDKARRVSPRIFDEHQDYYRITGNTIGFCRVASVGKVIEFRSNYPFKIAISPTLAIIEPKNIDKKFLAYCLRSRGISDQVSSLASGSTRESLGIKMLRELMVPVPPLPEQKRIAEILSGIDLLITNQEKKLRVLENLQIALIEEIALGKNDQGARKPTDIGECPTCWESVQLGEVADFANGNSFKSTDWAEAGYPIIRIQNLNGGADFNYFNGEVNAKWFVPSGSLLFSWSGQRGKSFGPFIWSGVDGVLNQHIFKVSYSEKIYQPFLFLLLKMVQIKAEREAHGFKDSFMHVKKSEIISTSVGIPPIAKQKELAAVYEHICQQINLERRKTASFVNLKSSCSSALLSGRKRVSV